MAGAGLFGDADSIERLADALLGASGHDGTAHIVRDVGDRVSQAVGGLVPGEWSGAAADAFERRISEQDVRDLLALSEAASGLGGPLTRLAADIRVANRRGEHAKELASAAGYSIDSSGNLGSDLLHSIEHLATGAGDLHAMTTAEAEMMAARHIAEDAWDTARHALASLPVPRIGGDTLQQAESWGFGNAAPPHPGPPGRGATRTGLLPTAPRTDSYAEQQRIEGIRFVQQHCERIREAAKRYGVPPEAIAGAILWEAVEDPRRSRLESPFALGPGPGKVHWIEWGKPSAAELAEDHGELPKASSFMDRRQRVVDPDGAIQYIGAILRDSAAAYQKIGFDISGPQDIGVLLTLYEEGDAETKARDLQDRRRTDRSAVPHMGADMGPWVVENLPWVAQQLPCPDAG